VEGAGRGWEEASTLMSWTRVGRGFNSKELDEGGKRLQLNESIKELGDESSFSIKDVVILFVLSYCLIENKNGQIWRFLIGRHSIDSVG